MSINMLLGERQDYGTHRQYIGDLAEHQILLYLVRAGYQAQLLSKHKFDLIIDQRDTPIRVQVKAINFQSNSITVDLSKTPRKDELVIENHYREKDFDFLAAVEAKPEGDLNNCLIYFIPANELLSDKYEGRLIRTVSLFKKYSEYRIQ